MFCSVSLIISLIGTPVKLSPCVMFTLYLIYFNRFSIVFEKHCPSLISPDLPAAYIIEYNTFSAEFQDKN